METGSTLILLGLCIFALAMVAIASAYYYANRDKLGV
jgi:peptidoglycan biosynthesis protein MviN/MurJ (putative lipid II flippase)